MTTAAVMIIGLLVIYPLAFVWFGLCYLIPPVKWVGVIMAVAGCISFAVLVGEWAPRATEFETVLQYVVVIGVYLAAWGTLWLLTLPLSLFFGTLRTAKEKPKFEVPVVT